MEKRARPRLRQTGGSSANERARGPRNLGHCWGPEWEGPFDKRLVSGSRSKFSAGRAKDRPHRAIALTGGRLGHLLG